MKNISIRVATSKDANSLLEIYKPYVLNTAITFEYEVPSLSEFQRRINSVLEKYPYLVAEENGEIVGYAYACAFHERPACGWAVETSVYVKQERKKQGIGKLLYQTLERILRLQNVVNMNASIAYAETEDPYVTKNSVQFHEHMGFSYVGAFHQCGYKFNRWYDLVWMEKQIGLSRRDMRPVIPFDEVKAELGL